MDRSNRQEGSSRKSHLSALIMVFLLALVALVSCRAPGVLSPTDGSDGKSVTLEWDANNEPDLAGYKIYYGTSSGSYEYCLDVGRQTSCTLTGLEPGQTYYITVTAYNSQGNESEYAPEITYTPSL